MKHQSKHNKLQKKPVRNCKANKVRRVCKDGREIDLSVLDKFPKIRNRTINQQIHFAECILPGLWAKGQSGNPHGRPKKGLAISDIVRKVADEGVGFHDEEGKKHYMSRVELIVRKALQQAAQGDSAARDFVADRAYGKVKQVIEEQHKQIEVGFE